jgi:hypothetical protein
MLFPVVLSVFVNTVRVRRFICTDFMDGRGKKVIFYSRPVVLSAFVNTVRVYRFLGKGDPNPMAELGSYCLGDRI